MPETHVSLPDAARSVRATAIIPLSGELHARSSRA